MKFTNRKNIRFVGKNAGIFPICLGMKFQKLAGVFLEKSFSVVALQSVDFSDYPEVGKCSKKLALDFFQNLMIKFNKSMIFLVQAFSIA